MSTEKKVILVTGGAQGLGYAISAILAQDATVVVGDIQLEKAAEAVRRIQEEQGDAHAMALDVSDEESVQTVIYDTVEKFGRLDVVINNAGIDVTKSIAALTVAEWDRVMAVNLRGAFVMAKFSLPVMAARKQGHIINIVSTAALRAWPEAAVYHASKWGLRGFSQALFTEARQHQVQVTAIFAGGMRTPFLLDRFPDIDPSKLQDPVHVARHIRHLIFHGTPETAVPEMMIIPLQETSWP